MIVYLAKTYVAEYIVLILLLSGFVTMGNQSISM